MEIIKPAELKQRVAHQEKPYILDVRETWEYEEFNIEGAKNVPLCSIPDRINELAQLKHAEIICHCKSGKRSHQAAKFLLKNGFTKVKSLEGGIEAYFNLQSEGPD
ncbi:rhodanese-like domain-containing protein [Fulvivirga sp. M361]|uniref:rhodanese-like domain-containing protein n=1 Tax=Fulvivirga sp. M361 TaxID=2594266 RepID=UPI001179F24E|nr:rhodanese-like domain-containing protein [Fulvivirga sp. M361]TRX61696.1 rhodanese-like domain-containing protein [Fulvivirga sp. M361]